MIFLPLGPQLSAHPRPGRSALEAELARIRRNGYAVDNEEYVQGLLCVAVPVIDSTGRTIAALAVQAPVARLPYTNVHHTLAALGRAAQEIAIAYERRPPLEVRVTSKSTS